MTHHFDEFSKALADPVPRRESLRRLGAVLAAAVVSPLGTAWAAPKGKAVKGKDPCQTFCKCRNKAQQNACLAACKACSGDTRRLCGACGSYYCADVANDVSNCGACGHVCPPPGPWEVGTCVDGRCTYRCMEGTVRCNGICTALNSDPNNCGACGNVCPESAPYCDQGVCFDPGCPPGLTWCDPACVDLLTDNYNCGACNNQCAPSEACSGGFCQGIGGGDWGY